MSAFDQPEACGLPCLVCQNLTQRPVPLSFLSLKINKDIGVESVTYLNDGLWHLDTKKLAIHN
jgi:hypothetical protein